MNGASPDALTPPDRRVARLGPARDQRVTAMASPSGRSGSLASRRPRAALLRASLRGSALLAVSGLLAGCNMVVMNPAGDIAMQQRNLIVASTALMLLVVVPVIALTFLFAWRSDRVVQAIDGPTLSGKFQTDPLPVAAELAVQEHTVGKWRRRFLDYVTAYNFARRLKTLKGLTPYE